MIFMVMYNMHFLYSAEFCLTTANCWMSYITDDSIRQHTDYNIVFFTDINKPLILSNACSK